MGDNFPYIWGLQDALNRDRSEVYMGDTFPYMDTQQKYHPYSKCRRWRNGIEPYTTAASRLDHITNTTSQLFTCCFLPLAGSSSWSSSDPTTPLTLRQRRLLISGCLSEQARRPLRETYESTCSDPGARYVIKLRPPCHVDILWNTHLQNPFLFNRVAQMRLVIK